MSELIRRESIENFSYEEWRVLNLWRCQMSLARAADQFNYHKGKNRYGILAPLVNSRILRHMPSNWKKLFRVVGRDNSHYILADRKLIDSTEQHHTCSP